MLQENSPSDGMIYEPEAKRGRFRDPEFDESQRFIEQFNQDMMEQFLAHQRKVQASFHKWELERQRQHELSMEKWRQEAREHEKEMFGMFVKVMGECNQALTNVLRVRASASARAAAASSADGSNGLTIEIDGADIDEALDPNEEVNENGDDASEDNKDDGIVQDN